MPIPRTQNFQLPLLRVIADAGGVLPVAEAIARVQRYFPDLREEDKAKLQPSGKEPVWSNRVRWARLQLALQGYLYRGPRGYWRITPQGEAYLKEHWDNWKPEYSDVKETESQPDSSEEVNIRPHERLKQLLYELGELFGYRTMVEFREPPYIYDVVWQLSPDVPRPVCVYEVQDKGNLFAALAKLQHARDVWGSHLFLLITDERDRKKAEDLVAPLLRGTFHRLAPHLILLDADQVEELHRVLVANRDVLKKMIQQ